MVVYVGATGAINRLRTWRNRGANVTTMGEAGLPPAPRIIAGGLTNAEAYAPEVETIAIHGRRTDGGTLENKALGGPTAVGATRSIKDRANMSAMRRGKKRKPLTLEHRAKISEGRRRPESTAKRLATIAARRLAQLAPTMQSEFAEPLFLWPRKRRV